MIFFYFNGFSFFAENRRNIYTYSTYAFSFSFALFLLVLLAIGSSSICFNFSLHWFLIFLLTHFIMHSIFFSLLLFRLFHALELAFLFCTLLLKIMLCPLSSSEFNYISPKFLIISCCHFSFVLLIANLLLLYKFCYPSHLYFIIFPFRFNFHFRFFFRDRSSEW